MVVAARAMQHQRPRTAVGADQPLPGLTRDNAVSVGCPLPGLLIDQLLRPHVALIEIDEDIIWAEESDLPQVARRRLAVEVRLPMGTQVTRVARQPSGRLVGARTSKGASFRAVRARVSSRPP